MPRACLPPLWVNNMPFQYIIHRNMCVSIISVIELLGAAGGNPKQVCCTPYAHLEINCLLTRAQNQENPSEMPGVRKTVSVPTGNSTGTVLVYIAVT